MASSACMGTILVRSSAARRRRSPFPGKCGFVGLAILASTYSHQTKRPQTDETEERGAISQLIVFIIDTHPQILLSSVDRPWDAASSCDAGVSRQAERNQYLSALPHPSPASNCEPPKRSRAAGARGTYAVPDSRQGLSNLLSSASLPILTAASASRGASPRRFRGPRTRDTDPHPRQRWR